MFSSPNFKAQLVKEKSHGNPSCHMFPLSLCTTLPRNIVPMLPLHDVIVIGSLLVTLKIPPGVFIFISSLHMTST